MDIKELFERFDTPGLIKTTEHPVVESAQKVALNRKGNMLFNAGDIEAARRIFMTTAYSDGLTRVGDAYLAQGRTIDALRMYWIAPDRKKAEAIVSRMSAVIQKLIGEEE